jgi:hypothetical protein
MVKSSRKVGVLPLIHPVASLAAHAEARSAVIDRPRRVVLGKMTGSTRRAESRKHGSRGAVMTGLAGRGGMGARQRKTVQMLPNCAYLNAPPLDGVATLTGSAELAPMDIRVTRRTVLRCFAEHRSDVATGAGDLAVLSQQWILRVFVVIELGNCTDRSPRLGDMAVLTGGLQIAVRAPRSLLLLGGYHERCAGCYRDDRQTEEGPQ